MAALFFNCIFNNIKGNKGFNRKIVGIRNIEIIMMQIISNKFN